MKNNLNLLVLLGIAFSGVGIFCIGIFAQTVIEDLRYSDDVRFELEHYIVAFLAFTFTTLGIGMALKKRWVRLPTTLVLILTGGGWGVFIVERLGRRGIRLSSNDPIIILVTSSIALFSIILFLILFINNEYTLRQFGIDENEGVASDNILDQ